jgi:hypothetical protein
MNNYANLMIEQGKLVKAEQIHQKVLAMRLRIFGNDHPATLISINNCADCLSKMGQWTDATLMFAEARTGLLAKLGEDHPWTTACADAFRCHEQRMAQEE